MALDALHHGQDGMASRQQDCDNQASACNMSSCFRDSSSIGFGATKYTVTLHCVIDIGQKTSSMPRRRLNWGQYAEPRRLRLLIEALLHSTRVTRRVLAEGR